MDAVKRIQALIAEALEKKRLVSSRDLIVNSISQSKGIQAPWHAYLPYGFHSALGLRYATRQKDKKKYNCWIQTPFLYFKEGDLIHFPESNFYVCVEEGQPVGFKGGRKSMFPGLVRFRVTRQAGMRFSCDQVAFLDLIVNGLRVIDERFTELNDYDLASRFRAS